MIPATLILLTLQAAPATAAPTIAEIDKLSPEAAGEAFLTGKDHGPIARIIVPPTRGAGPPGAVERQLIERSVVGAEGCSRRRWTVIFFHGPGVAEDQARLRDAWASTEVALRGPAGCPDEGYVRLNPGFEPARAFAALKQLDALRRGATKAQFTCADETSSKLCSDPRKIPRALAKLSPQTLADRGGETVFWLHDSGAAVTEVRYNQARPDRVTVSRKIPAPF